MMNQPETLIAQELIDMTFSMVSLVLDEAYHKAFMKMSQEEKMAWVAKQFRECGYPTQPMGASWGVLMREASKPAEFRPQIVEANRPE